MNSFNNLMQGFLGLQIRTFVFQNQVTSTSTSIDSDFSTLRQSCIAEPIDVSQVFHRFRNETGTANQKVSFKVYHPHHGTYSRLPVSNPQTMPSHFFLTPMILIKYKVNPKPSKPLQSDTESMQSSSTSTISDMKKERNSERSVREVIQLVRQWREIHNSIEADKPRVNLQDAAKMLGVSKKSLDDYFCQLRLAEQYKFDFQGNLDERIGVLRAFVKRFRPKGDRQKHEKHPKRLRVIEQLRNQLGKYHKVEVVVPQQNPEPVYNNNQDGGKMETEQEQIGDKTDKAILEELHKNQDQQNKMSNEYYENQFYNNFNFMLHDPDDPFIPLQEVDYVDFSKKDVEFDENFIPW